MIDTIFVPVARRLFSAAALAALVAGGVSLAIPVSPAAASIGCGPTVADDLYDADGDGRGCYAELNIDGTDPYRYDTDGDGLGDGDEGGIYGTGPTSFDTDGDGVGDGEEVRLGMNPLAADFAPGQAPSPGAQNLPGYDYDGDGLGAYDEQTYGTDVTRYDTDGDGLGDGAEVAYPTNPLAFDTDGDGYGDGFEVAHNMDPLFFNPVGP